MKVTYLLGRLGLILFGILLFGVLELGLRLFWEPPPDPGRQLLLSSIDPFVREGDDYVVRESFRAALRPARFKADKGTDTIRIFCLGGSATFGYPYEEHHSWPAGLQRSLQHAYPGVNIEVVNLGGTSYGTTRVLGLLRGIVRYSPDLVVVYSGNNEFVEDSYRAQAMAQQHTVPGLENLYLSRALRTLLPQHDEHGLAAPVPVEEGDSSLFFFSPTVDGSVYQPTSRQREEVLARYRDNLQGMIELAQRNKFPLLLATVASNLSGWPPGSGDESPLIGEEKVRWLRLHEAARQAHARNRVDEAITRYKDALALYPGDAAANYALGTLLLRQGKPEQARESFVRALDVDPAPVRTDSAMNATIRALAEKERVPLADVEAMIARAAPAGIPGDALFIDNVHPTLRGNLEIARAISTALWRASLLPTPATEPGEPFWNAAFARSSAQPELDANLAFTWGQVYLRKGLLDKAEALLRSAIAQGYSHPSARYYLADTLARQGADRQAFRLLEETLAQHPDYLEPLPLLARLAARLGEIEIAVTRYRQIMEQGNAPAESYTALALLHLRRGESDPAASTIDDGLQRYPHDCALLATRGRVDELRGNLDRAEVTYQSVLESDPGCQAGWENLGLLQLNQQRFDEASTTFEAALQQPGAPASHHLNLGLAYHLSGATSEAREQFTLVIEQTPELAGYIPAPYREELLDSRQLAQ